MRGIICAPHTKPVERLYVADRRFLTVAFKILLGRRGDWVERSSTCQSLCDPCVNTEAMGRLVRVAPLLAAVLALGVPGALPGSALAKGKGVAPPGNSGVSQYMEDIPTIHGEKPTSSVVVPPNPGGGSGGGGSSSSGSGSSSGGSSGSAGSSGSSGVASSSAIPNSVVKKLEHSGSAGKAAIALAEATSSAPAKSRPRKSSPAAPATSVVRALTGSTGGGGLGAFLPVLLIGLLVVLSAVGIFQRRRPA